MSDPAAPVAAPADARSALMKARLAKRYAAERRFRLLGFAAIAFSGIVLLYLLVTMTANSIGGFQRAEVTVPIDLRTSMVTFDPQLLGQTDAAQALENAGLPKAVNAAAVAALGPEGAAQISDQAWREVATTLVTDPGLLRRPFTASLPASDDIAGAMRGSGTPELREQARQLQRQGKLAFKFDAGFLTRSDATNPQQAGIWGALKGSMLTMLVTLVLAFPVGVLAAVYLEEYAPRNRWTDLIEISINNLAAVPSIIFGLLGLAVFLAIFPNYRSAPLIGGMTLALMTMPVIVISARNAIKSVPPSIRDGALAIGASRIQTVFHHILPLALPGILTGAIIGMARALGETAPLLMIGMRAFVATPPAGFTAPSSVLPVQIFLWSDEIDRGFVERTSAAIVVLLLFLLAMNGLAIYLRNRFEQRR
ncbi:phosphate ABC transporter permease PstA [Novosphingobium tardum]|uniref:Phosphate transport system permease protein PstA n=1 Tax=Novosphingobium tardum TaxID=1538021 RepID=A0ABV8RSI6_9SPHN